MYKKYSATIRTAVVSILCVSVFIVILLQNHNTTKHLEELQISIQLLNKKSFDLTSTSTPKELVDQKIISNINQEISAIKQQNSQMQNLIQNIDVTSQALIRNAMAEKVESIVKDKITTEEKVIAIAKWVSSNTPNNLELGTNVYTYFGGRNGLCAMRTQVFVDILKYINVYSSFYNICEFPTCNEAHSTAQVYYDNEWHFFDVTYAGYFRMNGNILSFEEIVEISKKEDALKYLITFDETLDRYRSIRESSLHLLSREEITKTTKVDNKKRMHQVYARDNLLKVSDYRFFDNTNCLCHSKK